MKRRIQKIDLVRAFFRTLFVQGSWNYKSLIGLGFGFCAVPFARRLYKSDEERSAFLSRHIEFFNAHPFFASWCLGAVGKLEEEAIRKKWSDAKPITIFKERLIGPLGAIGDQLFWNGIKPLCAGIGVWIGLVSGWIALPVFLIIYNVPHFYVRILGLTMGYRHGFDIVSALSVRRFQPWIQLVVATGVMVCGMVIIAGSKWAWLMAPGYVPAFLISILITVIFLRLKISINISLLVSAALAMLLQLIF
jgi:mannose/fructose/N-acetylgalactosamine-specific phosphotransferase system component IID